MNWAKVEAFRPYGGIRIEDDVACTGDAPENLTRDAFAAAAWRVTAIPCGAVAPQACRRATSRREATTAARRMLDRGQCMRDESRHRSWFRTRDGRAYLAGLGAIVALKIALLAALYLAIIAPQPRVPPTPKRNARTCSGHRPLPPEPARWTLTSSPCRACSSR